MKFRAFLAASAALLFSAPAFAMGPGDVVVEPRAFQSPWTGASVKAYVGYTQGKLTDTYSTPLAMNGQSAGIEGVYQVGTPSRWVFGAGIRAEDAFAKGQNVSGFDFCDNFSNCSHTGKQTETVKQGFSGAAFLRAGFGFTNFLIYADAGWGFTSLTHGYKYDYNGIYPVSDSKSELLGHGPMFDLGGDLKLGTDWGLNFQVSHSEFTFNRYGDSTGWYSKQRGQTTGGRVGLSYNL
jgi:hypothetical protein